MSNDDTSATSRGSESNDLLGLAAMKPACWALTTMLDGGETTTRGFLWFTNPQNSAWEPLYRRAALCRVLRNAVSVQDHNVELAAKAPPKLRTGGWWALTGSRLIVESAHPAGGTTHRELSDAERAEWAAWIASVLKA